MRENLLLACCFAMASICSCSRSDIQSHLSPNSTGTSSIAASIQGNIFNQQGMPAAFVPVSIGKKSVITDSVGYFKIDNASLNEAFQVTSSGNAVLDIFVPISLQGIIPENIVLYHNDGSSSFLMRRDSLNKLGNVYSGKVHIDAKSPMEILVNHQKKSRIILFWLIPAASILLFALFRVIRKKTKQISKDFSRKETYDFMFDQLLKKNDV